MTLNWFPLVLFYIITNASSKLLQRYTVQNEEVEPPAYSGYFFLVCGLLSIPFLYFEQIKYPTEPKLWIVLLLSSIFYTVSMLLFFKALKAIEVSQVEAIATTRTIWLMLLGIIFFKEQLYFSQIIGIFLIFLGLIVIYWQKGTKFNFQKFHLYTLFYAIIISCAYALDKYLLNYFSVVFFNFVIYLIPGILTLIFVPNSFNNIKILIKPQKNNYLIILCCFLQIASTIALYAAYQIGELSLIGPLAQTSVIITITVSLVVLKERWNMKRKILGIALALLGIAFIRFFIF